MAETAIALRTKGALKRRFVRREDRARRAQREAMAGTAMAYARNACIVGTSTVNAGGAAVRR